MKVLADGHRETGAQGNTSPRPNPQRGEGATISELQAKGVVCLTKTQMAAVLQISINSLNRMIARREISFYKIGRLVRFRLEDALQRMNETVLVAAAAGGGK